MLVGNVTIKERSNVLGEPARTQFDLNFSLLGFAVRVSGWFWLGVMIIGWNRTAPVLGGGSNEQLRNVITWLAVVLVSILIHELGHALAFRRYGVSSHIVLYHFGGLAIPDAYAVGGDRPHQRIIIAAAGPLLQMASALVLILIISATGRIVPVDGFAGDFLSVIDRLLGRTEDLKLWTNAPLLRFCDDYLFVSINWAILNLIPVYPLDGGQIFRELFLIYDRRDPIKHSLMLSIGFSIVAALWAWSSGQRFMVFLFVYLGVSSYITLNQYTGRNMGQRW